MTAVGVGATLFNATTFTFTFTGIADLSTLCFFLSN